MGAQTLHLCLDVTTDRVKLTRLLRDVASDCEDRELSYAIGTLASAIDDAPVVPVGVMATFALGEEPGKGLSFDADDAPKLVRVGIEEAMKMVPGQRVARVAVVAHMVFEDEGEVPRG